MEIVFQKTNGVGDDIKINDHCKTYPKFCVLYRFVTVCGWQGEIISKNPKLIGVLAGKGFPSAKNHLAISSAPPGNKRPRLHALQSLVK